MIVLGIDVGTTGTKAIALSDDGRVIGRGYREYSLDSRAGGIVEQDADDWISAIVSAVGDAVMYIREPNEIAAISLSTQGATMTAVDRDFHPLCPAITWMDNRATKEAEELAKKLGEEAVYRKCGWGISPCYDIEKIMWLKANRPDIYENAYSFVSTVEYVNHFLTGENVIDPTNAAIRGMYNINTRAWDGEIISAAGIDAKKLPDALSTGEYIGTLTKEAASKLRLPESVRVYNGAHDQYCAALGSGALNDGDMLLSCGTTWVVLGVTGSPVYTESRIAPGIHPCGLYGAMASLTSAGSALKWFNNITGGGSYADIDKIAETRRENAKKLFFMPYIAGAGFPERNGDMGGAAIGMRLHNDKYDLALALMEGVAFETKNALAEFSRAGIDIGRLRMVGGAAKSGLWSSIVAYVTGCEVTRMTEGEGCALGAAMIAAVGCGMYKSYGEACDALVSGERVIADEIALYDFYRDKYNKYDALCTAVRGEISKW